MYLHILDSYLYSIFVFANIKFNVFFNLVSFVRTHFSCSVEMCLYEFVIIVMHINNIYKIYYLTRLYLEHSGKI